MTISNDDLLWERRARVKEQQLKPLLTDVFLNTLAEAARTCGWAVDHAESADFVDWCFDLAGKPRVNLDAYDYSKDI